MLTLCKRLNAVAERVLPGCAMADIGTDHAHLPLRLLLDGRVPRAIASDRVVALIDAARPLVSAWNLGEKLELRVGDGLAVLAPGECSTVVMAGLGARAMMGMLTRVDARSLGVQRLVLQPNRQTELLREGLLGLGWCMVDELAVTREHKLLRREQCSQARWHSIVVFEG